MREPAGPVLTADAMRLAEQACVEQGVSLSQLMDRAGNAVAEAVWRFGGGRPILILCGPGNNGGDGYVAARLLRERGLDVRVAAYGEPQTDLARHARAGWEGPVEHLADATHSAVLVDALFGTGLSRPLDQSISTELKRLVLAAQFALAVDLPSGVGTDDGRHLGASVVSMTLALGALKPAHLLMPSAAFCGAIRVADIGVKAASDLDVVQRPHLVVPGPESHKYRRGYVAIYGGTMAGAALLAARAAMPLAGYVALCGAKRQGPDALVHRRWADLADDSRIGALLVGPGLGQGDKARQALDDVMASDHALVLDADALRLLGDAGLDALKARAKPVILTPHEGEFAALFPSMEGSKIARAQDAAARSGAIIILKGADTVVAAPDGRSRIACAVPGWLASAGTGDVLAGLCTARLSSGVDAFTAACDAVWLHGETARRAGPAFIADDLPDFIPQAVEQCL